MNFNFYQFNKRYNKKGTMLRSTLAGVVKEDFPRIRFKFDSSIGWGEDLIPDLKEVFPFTVRSDKKGRIRMPATQRLHLYKGAKPYSTDDNLGYLLLEGFIVCSFGDLEKVMTEDISESGVTFVKPDFDNLEYGIKEYPLGIFSCNADVIKARKERLLKIYEHISNDSFVSVYLGRSAFIDERPFMKCLADSKKE